MDIDRSNRPIEQLLPNLFQKFKRCPVFKITEADRRNGVKRESLNTMSADRIEYVRA